MTLGVYAHLHIHYTVYISSGEKNITFYKSCYNASTKLKLDTSHADVVYWSLEQQHELKIFKTCECVLKEAEADQNF